MVFAVLFGLLPIAATAAPKADCPIDLVKMNGFLDSLAHYKNNSNLQKEIEKGAGPEDPERFPSPSFPAWISEQFDSYQTQLFGAKPLKFFPALNFDNASFDSKRRTVYFGDHFLSELSAVKVNDKSVLPRFIAAHELSHFIQDLSVQTNDGEHTLNGMIYDEEKNESVMNAMEKLAGLRANKKISEEEYFKRAAPHLEKIACLHAEVDAYAILVMKRANFPYPKEIDAWLLHSLEQYGPTSEKNYVHKSDNTLRLKMSQHLQRQMQKK